jgi:hypothetical protein
MKKMILTRIPAISFYFTITVLISSISNLLEGYRSMGNLGLIEIFLFITLCNIINIFVNKIDFKSYISYVLTESSIIYVLFLLFCYITHWIEFSMMRFIYVTIIYILITIIGYFYFYQRHKMNSDEVNQLLKKRE